MMANGQDIATLRNIFDTVAKDMRHMYCRNTAFSVEVENTPSAVVIKIKKQSEGEPETYHDIAHDSEIRAELVNGYIRLNGIFVMTARNAFGAQYTERGELSFPARRSLVDLQHDLSHVLNSSEMKFLMDNNTALYERDALKGIESGLLLIK